MTKETFAEYMQSLADVAFQDGKNGYDRAFNKMPKTFIVEISKHDLWSNGDRDDGRDGHEQGANTALEMSQDYNALEIDLFADHIPFSDKNTPIEQIEHDEYFKKLNEERETSFTEQINRIKGNEKYSPEQKAQILNAGTKYLNLMDQVLDQRDYENLLERLDNYETERFGIDHDKFKFTENNEYEPKYNNFDKEK